MTDYILEISFDPDLDEIIHGRLFLTRSCGSVSIREGLISAYFETASDRQAAVAALQGIPATVTPEERPNVDWLERYQQSLQPLLIGRSFVVAPDAALIPPGTGRHALVIPQEQAFGTGSHESTALCIELLEEIDLRGARGIDIGAGSGILALAMLCLGAQKVVAFDNDLDAFAPMRENRSRNQAAALSLFVGSIETLRSGVFDVATMNILPEVIMPMLPLVRSHVSGALIVSGILATSRDEVVHSAGLRLLNERQKGEWWAGTFSV